MRERRPHRGRREANSAPPTTTLTMREGASVAGEPISGITKNGRTNVATIGPNVLTASREPVDRPSVAGRVARAAPPSRGT